MELRDYLHLLRKQLRLILLCAILGVAAAGVATLQATPQYRTSVKFFVSTPATAADAGSAYSGGLFSQQRVKSYADIVSGASFAQSIAKALGTSEASVRGAISANAVPDTVLLRVTVSSASPRDALAIANAVASEFPGIVANLEASEEGSVAPIKASVSERPELPRSAYSPRAARNLILGLVIGLLLGVVLAIARETLDTSVKNPDDVREASGSATLGAIAFDPSAPKRPLIVQDKPRAPRAEAFRQLRTNLQFVEIDQPLRSFVLTSSVPNEGKSTMACNLAITLAQAGISVCLVEGDLRRPRIADYMGLNGAIGLTSVVIGRTPLEDALQPWGSLPLSVLASGPLPPNPSELLSSRGMSQLVTELERRFTVVVIDAPPLLPVTDGAILASITSGALLSVHCGQTTKDQLRHATQALQAVNATILGSVLNMVPRRIGSAYSAYGYGYGYGYGEKSYGTDGSRPQMSDEDALLATRQEVPKIARPKHGVRDPRGDDLARRHAVGVPPSGLPAPWTPSALAAPPLAPPVTPVPVDPSLPPVASPGVGAEPLDTAPADAMSSAPQALRDGPLGTKSLLSSTPSATGGNPGDQKGTVSSIAIDASTSPVSAPSDAHPPASPLALPLADPDTDDRPAVPAPAQSWAPGQFQNGGTATGA